MTERTTARQILNERGLTVTADGLGDFILVNMRLPHTYDYSTGDLIFADDDWHMELPLTYDGYNTDSVQVANNRWWTGEMIRINETPGVFAPICEGHDVMLLALDEEFDADELRGWIDAAESVRDYGCLDDSLMSDVENEWFDRDFNDMFWKEIVSEARAQSSELTDAQEFWLDMLDQDQVREVWDEHCENGIVEFFTENDYAVVQHDDLASTGALLIERMKAATELVTA